VASRIGHVAPVTGGEVRDTWFLDARGGYPGYRASDVDELLRRVADELDAGRPAGPLIEDGAIRLASWRRAYNIDAVDWFLGQLLRPQDHAGPGGTSADPWRDAGDVTQLVLGGVSGLAERSPPADNPAPRKGRRWFEEQCENASRGFGQLPGTRLPWRPVGEGRPATVSAGGRTFTWPTERASSSLPGIAGISRRDPRDYEGHFAAGQRAWPPSEAGARGLVDETGKPILYTSGKNENWRACARIWFPDGRWLRFLVRGTSTNNAIMTAVDQAGNKVARYRQGTEIIVHPDQNLTDQLVLAITISASWLASYFHVPQKREVDL